MSRVFAGNRPGAGESTVYCFFVRFTSDLGRKENNNQQESIAAPLFQNSISIHVNKTHGGRFDKLLFISFRRVTYRKYRMRQSIRIVDFNRCGL